MHRDRRGDRLPKLVQTLLMTDLTNAQPFLAVCVH